jgi:RimJ/RimL family protein N-acetyltransferase
MAAAVTPGSGVRVVDPFPAWGVHYAWQWTLANWRMVADDFHPRTYTEFAGLLDQAAEGRCRMLGIERDNVLAGALIFEFVNPATAVVHLMAGRALLGHADTAARLGVWRMFSVHPELRRVAAFVMQHNRLALALARRVGFIEEGRLRRHTWQDGEPVDVVVLGITREEFYAYSLAGSFAAGAAGSQRRDGRRIVQPDGEHRQDADADIHLAAVPGSAIT